MPYEVLEKHNVVFSAADKRGGRFMSIMVRQLGRLERLAARVG